MRIQTGRFCSKSRVSYLYHIKRSLAQLFDSQQATKRRSAIRWTELLPTIALHVSEGENVQYFPPHFPLEPGGVSKTVVAVSNCAPTVLDWLALAKVSFNGLLAGIGTSCLASVHPMWQLAPYLQIYLWGTHDIPAAVKEKHLGGCWGKLVCHWLMYRACLPVCFSCPSWWRWAWPPYRAAASAFYYSLHFRSLLQNCC